MQISLLLDAFETILSHNEDALRWGNPEPWVHAELYAEFKRQAPHTGWEPFYTEVPYVTAYPVQLPKTSNRDWISEGAVKWIDLCLQSDTNNDWCWFEFKVRHPREAYGRRKAASEARDAFRKDIVALMGFDVNATANIWGSPDDYTTAYWFEDTLKPYTEKLRLGNHQFVSAFLQLGSTLEEELWSKEAIIEQVNMWKTHRSTHKGREVGEKRDLKLTSKLILDRYWVVIVESFLSV